MAWALLSNGRLWQARVHTKSRYKSNLDSQSAGWFREKWSWGSATSSGPWSSTLWRPVSWPLTDPKLTLIKTRGMVGDFNARRRHNFFRNSNVTYVDVGQLWLTNQIFFSFDPTTPAGICTVGKNCTRHKKSLQYSRHDRTFLFKIER